MITEQGKKFPATLAKEMKFNIILENSQTYRQYPGYSLGNVVLSAKVFITETDTGKVEVPKSVTGGRCEIETDTGDIQITVTP